MTVLRGNIFRRHNVTATTTVESKPTFPVKLIKDTSLVFPELWMDVYVTGPESETYLFPWMLARARCKKASSPETADLVIFTGGEDVNPALYNETKHSTVTFDAARDDEEIKLYEYCVQEGIPMIGVCRGAQFLHVMNGGKLYQHIDGHHGQHGIWDMDEKKYIHKISSVHHQSVRPNNASDFEVIATGGKTTKRFINATDYEINHGDAIEAFFYRSTCCLGVQGHPEYTGFHEYTHWFLNKVDRFINQNPDLGLINKFRRIKPEARGLDPSSNTKEDERATINGDRIAEALGVSVH